MIQEGKGKEMDALIQLFVLKYIQANCKMTDTWLRDSSTRYCLNVLLGSGLGLAQTVQFTYVQGWAKVWFPGSVNLR